MTKIRTIQIKNCKAISEIAVNLDGCSAIVTAANDKGKSTLAKVLIDRLRGEKPEIIVKEGEKDGYYFMDLTSGERFEWQFSNDGKEKLTFITKEGYKTKVTKEINTKFFPVLFDIDSFLESRPKEQSKMLEKLVGIDFTEIDSQYKMAYDNRTYTNKRLTEITASINSIPAPEKCEIIDIEALVKQKEKVRETLNNIYLANKTQNETKRKNFEAKQSELRNEINSFNECQKNLNYVINSVNELLNRLITFGYKGNEVKEWIASLPQPQPQKDFIVEVKNLKQPDYIPELPDDSELEAIDNRILEANNINIKAKEYENYQNQLKLVDEAKKNALEADKIVKEIEAKRKEMVCNASLPAGFEFTPDGVLYHGLPLQKKQLSTSKLYIAALQLAAMKLGEVKILHFDASPLDKNNLADVEKWASENNLQLLIEIRDFEGGEIQYQLIKE